MYIFVDVVLSMHTGTHSEQHAVYMRTPNTKINCDPFTLPFAQEQMIVCGTVCASCVIVSVPTLISTRIVNNFMRNIRGAT